MRGRETCGSQRRSVGGKAWEFRGCNSRVVRNEEKAVLKGAPQRRVRARDGDRTWCGVGDDVDGKCFGRGHRMT